MRDGNVKTIALFLPGWVGDAVMATPAVRAVGERFPDAHVIAVMKPYVADVLAGSPWIHEKVLLHDKGTWRDRWPGVARLLRTKNVDLAVLFPNSFRSALVAWLGGCKQRIGYARYGRQFLLTDALGPKRDVRGRLQVSPVIDAYNRLARHVGCDDPGYRMELFPNDIDRAMAQDLWRRQRWHAGSEVITLNPGAAFGSAKFWPAEYFISLGRMLVDRRGCGVLVLCGPKERDIARSIARKIERPGVTSLADEKISLGLTMACIRESTLLVTTDSGPRHFGTAFDRPVVTLFGPTHIEWTETYHPAAVNLQKKVDCGPCQLRTCPLDHRCMKQLTPFEVFNAVCHLLGRRAMTG